MKLKMRGKVWTLERKRLKELDGQCDPPNLPNKRIFIHAGLRGEKELDAIIHELTHAAHWDLDEPAVDEFSTDLARILWRMGYRKQDEKA